MRFIMILAGCFSAKPERLRKYFKIIAFYEPIVNATLENGSLQFQRVKMRHQFAQTHVSHIHEDEEMDKILTSHNIEDKDLFMLFVQYRGR